ncbi:MAG: hypothetical protein PHQ12_02055 [Chthoniobacteraceae bacterium]|nr:hypothetical protein [Chthoniobacteraceae bacterium]
MAHSDTLAPSTSLLVDAAAYLAIPAATRVHAQLAITLTDHSYQPRVDDLESDWVAHVAVPAFKLYRQQRGGAAIDAFCSIGTGSGLDVLSAVEILGANRVALTDVHWDVVAAASGNIARNHLQPLTIQADYGDLLAPLRRFGARYDVIYENLPNVPLANPEELALDRKSSSYVPPRTEALPELVKRQMLDLHYLALLQSREFLAPGGAVLSCLGARMPLEVFLRLGELAGCRSSFLTYTWKVQGDPGEVIRDHAASQAKGFGPFHFYRAEVLKKTFAAVKPEESGARALEIEQELLPKRLDAASAFAAFQKGEKIGHTVAMLQSVL